MRYALSDVYSLATKNLFFFYLRRELFCGSVALRGFIVQFGPPRDAQMTKPIVRDSIYRRRRFDAEIIELCVRSKCGRLDQFKRPLHRGRTPQTGEVLQLEIGKMLHILGHNNTIAFTARKPGQLARRAH
jgi:hypothetical protein